MNRPLMLVILILLTLTGAQAQTRRPGTPPANRPAAPRPATPAPAGTNTPAPGPPALECVGCDTGAVPSVLAVVNGIKITSADLSAETVQQIGDLARQMATARKQELERQINAKLLDAEAKKRGVTADKLFETEVTARIPQPTDAEVQAFYEQHKPEIEAQLGHAAALQEVREQIVNTMLVERQGDYEQQLSARLRTGAQYQVFATDVQPPANAAERARVLATVNGQSITAANIEDAVRPLIPQVQTAAYELRQQDLDTRINDLLLQQEAQKRQMTARALYDAEVGARVKPVTEADARTFYNQNKERVTGEFAQIKDQLIEYLKQQELTRASGVFADELRRKATIQTFLQPPVVPALNIATDDQPARGAAAAKVTIVEFADFQCPSCAALQPTLERLMTEYGDRVRLVARDFPLTQHKSAAKAAEAAEAARAQGKYWEYAALLYKQQAAAATPEAKEAALAVPKLKEYATQLGLNRPQFDAALDSGRFAAQVARDQQDGIKLGVGHTPTLYINGRAANDISYDALKATLDAALRPGAK
jgi:protein-disulfide isomerase